jgi:Mg/Co/Ni transporter MgtE
VHKGDSVKGKMKMSSKNSVAQVSQREFLVRTILGLALAAASAAMITFSFAPYNL